MAKVLKSVASIHEAPTGEHSWIRDASPFAHKPSEASFAALSAESGRAGIGEVPDFRFLTAFPAVETGILRRALGQPGVEGLGDAGQRLRRRFRVESQHLLDAAETAVESVERD